MRVRIDYAICNSCGLCREVCPESAITQKYLEARHLYEVHAARRPTYSLNAKDNFIFERALRYR
jgi:ferredoxin